MQNTAWTDWFMVVFKDSSDAMGLYGRNNHVLIKIGGSSEMPEKVAFTMLIKSFKFVQANLRFKDTIYCWDADALIIR